MRITDKDTADDVKYHLMAENPPEPLVMIDEIESATPEQLQLFSEVIEHGKITLIPKKASGCTDYFTLADGTKICKIRSDTAIYVSCENRVKNGECPNGCRKV